MGHPGAAAQVAAAQAQFEQTQIAARQAATSGIAAAQAEVTRAEANSRKAQADLDRMRQLAAKEEISRQQFDAFVAAAQVAAAQLTIRPGAVEFRPPGRRKSGGGGTGGAGPRFAGPRFAAGIARRTAAGTGVHRTVGIRRCAAIEQARANLAAAELNLSYCDITAPLDGVVTQKSVEPGQMLQPGQGLDDGGAAP